MEEDDYERIGIVGSEEIIAVEMFQCAIEESFYMG